MLKIYIQDFLQMIVILCLCFHCTSQTSQDPIFVPGVWGPYFSSMYPGLWGNEGGQSITGKLIDHVIHSHPAYSELVKRAKQR